MKNFTLSHVNGNTGARQTVNVQTDNPDALLRLFNAMAEDDPWHNPNGQIHLQVAYGTLSLIPFEED